jgi:DNA-binding transcriptional ArsR family regulator
LEEQEFDEVLRALSHPDRRLFVRACLHKERAAGDLAGLSNLSLATVSEHLKVLRKAGLLILNREGRFWLYRTDRVALAALADDIARLGAD